MSACSGHCCRAFILSKPLPEIKAAVANGVQTNNPDWVYVAQNFFEIGELNPTVMLRPQFRVAGISRMLHSCRQYDHATGRCRDYDNRPQVCRGHPDYDEIGRACEYDGCTYQDIRQQIKGALNKVVVQ